MALEREDSQEGISKDDYLDDLISEIDGLLERNSGLNKFQNHFDNFCSMVESHSIELDKYHEAAKNKFNDFARTYPKTLIISVFNAINGVF